MTEKSTELPVKTEAKSGQAPAAHATSRPFESLRRGMNHLFDEFDHDFWAAPFRRAVFDVEPFWRRELTLAATPAVDIVESEKGFEITADLPGYDEKSVEVKIANGNLVIKGEKQEETEQKKRDYYLHERHFGSFERCFRIPDSVDADKLEASFKKGVLTVTLPKKAEAQKPEKKIEVKAA